MTKLNILEEKCSEKRALESESDQKINSVPDDENWEKYMKIEAALEAKLLMPIPLTPQMSPDLQ